MVSCGIGSSVGASPRAHRVPPRSLRRRRRSQRPRDGPRSPRVARPHGKLYRPQTAAARSPTPHPASCFPALSWRPSISMLPAPGRQSPLFPAHVPAAGRHVDPRVPLGFQREVRRRREAEYVSPPRFSAAPVLILPQSRASPLPRSPFLSQSLRTPTSTLTQSSSVCFQLISKYPRC